MKQGYLVGYSFNRYNTLTSYAFLVQTSDKRLAQSIAKKWCAAHKKEESVSVRQNFYLQNYRK